MDRFTWGIVAGVLLLVAAGLATAITLQGRSTPTDLGTPEGVTLAYAQALQDGDGDRAWNLLAPEAQAQTTRTRFLTIAPGGGGSQERLGVESPTYQGDEVAVVLVRTYSGGGGLFPSSPSSGRSTVRLKRDGTDWKILVPPDPYVLSPGP